MRSEGSSLEEVSYDHWLWTGTTDVLVMMLRSVRISLRVTDTGTVAGEDQSEILKLLKSQSK